MNDTAVFRISIAVAAALTSANALGAGAVVFDNTLPGQPHGTTTTVPLTAGKYTIDAANTGYLSNTNLFESFATFIVGAGEEADFTNANHLAINNVISRVTGIGDPNGLRPTSIDGKLVSTIAGANFWFVNPAGVTVGAGAGAQINVPAGLAIGSADYIQFADNSRWYALPSGSPTPSVLATADPKVFGFLTNTSVKAVSVNDLTILPSAQLPYIYLEGSKVDLTASHLTADPVGSTGSILVIGKSVSIIGSTLFTPNGIVGIAAVPSLDNLTLLPVQGPADFLFGNISAPNSLKTALVSSFGPTLGQITLTNSYVHTDGNSGGGGIYILGGQIQVGGNLGTNAIPYGNGLDASSDGGTPVGVPATFGVHVYGQSFEMDGNNQIDSIARGAGDTGPIDIALTGDLVLDGTHDAPSLGAYGTPGLETFSTAIFSEAAANSSGNGGDISITAANLSIVGPAAPPAPLAAGTNGGPGSPAISSFSDSSGNAGNITISLSGDLKISGFAWTYGLRPTPQDPSAKVVGLSGGGISADAFDGTGGNITINANSLELRDGAQIASASLNDGPAGTIDITLGGHLIMASDPRNLFGTGIFSHTTQPTGANAGDITIRSTTASPSAGYMSIQDSRILSEASASGGAAGSVDIEAAGPIQMSGTTINTTVFDSAQDAGKITVSAGGLVNILNSQIESSSSGGGTGNGGQISISGSGVLIGRQSLVKADFNNAGGSSGAPGSVAIYSTAAAATDDPLAAQLSTATDGVVRIVDSGVTARNSGGLGDLVGNVGNVSGRGEIWIGQSLPDPAHPTNAPTVSQDVIVAGAVISNDVDAGGLGNNLSVVASHGVWIAGAPSGTTAYAKPAGSGSAQDPRAGASTGTQTQSLISAETANSAASGGRVLIRGGSGGVNIADAILDANDQATNDPPRLGFVPTQSNIDINVGDTGGPVVLTRTTVTTETFGANPAGDITISGGSVSITDGELSAATSSASHAGNITVKSAGADAVDGTASLRINGTLVQSKSAGTAESSTTQAIIAGDAGNVLIEAGTGSVALGDAAKSGQSTEILTSANPGAGQAGTITIQSDQGNLSLNQTVVDTTVATSRITDASNSDHLFVPAKILLRADKGAVAVADSIVLAKTYGAVAAGDITILGATINVTGANTQISAATTSDPDPAGFTLPVNTGSAGNILLKATGAAGASGAAALQVSGGARVSSDANDGKSTDTNAGTITLTAVNGTVQVGLPSESSASRTELSTAAGAAAGQVGYLTISGSSVNIDNARLSAETHSNVDPQLGKPAISIGSAGGATTLGASDLSAATSAGATASNILITGSTVSISGGSVTASTTGTGNAGSVSITATGADGGGTDALSVKNGANIASNASQGRSSHTNAGEVKLTASNGTVQVGAAGDPQSTEISTAAGAEAGAPGAVTITGRGIDLGRAQITTAAGGVSPGQTRGSIVLNAADGTGMLKVANSTLDATTTGVQPAGEIDLQGAPIQISNATISSATHNGTGPAGAICVSSDCGISGSVLGGQGGSTRSVRLTGAAASVGGISITDSTLSTSTDDTAAAGDVNLTTGGALVLSGANVLSQSTSTAADAGPVGVIQLTGGSVSVTGGSTVSAISKGGTAAIPGGGAARAAITINSTDGSAPLQVTDSTITTQAQVTNGSNIVVNAGGSPVLLRNSVVTASAVGGNGGNITVNQAGNTALQRSEVVAQAGPGNGGAININLKRGAIFVQDSESLVSATSKSGNNGTVTINSPQTDLNSALRVPEVSVVPAPELTANVCRPQSGRSTFVREGRGGVAADPQDYLGAPPAALQASTASNVAGPPLLLLTATSSARCP